MTKIIPYKTLETAEHKNLTKNRGFWGYFASEQRIGTRKPYKTPPIRRPNYLNLFQSHQKVSSTHRFFGTVGKLDAISRKNQLFRNYEALG